VAVSPLTTAQQRAVEELVATRRLEQVPVDEQRRAAFLQQAETALADLSNVRHAQNRYNLAYDAAHDVGEAMLAAYGYRTMHGPGQHDALGRFLAAVFDTPPENRHPGTSTGCGVTATGSGTAHARSRRRRLPLPRRRPRCSTRRAALGWRSADLVGHRFHIPADAV
jgi:hypothetical protein